MYDTDDESDDTDDKSDDADDEADDDDDNSDLAAHADISRGVGSSPQGRQHIQAHSLRKRLESTFPIDFQKPYKFIFHF